MGDSQRLEWLRRILVVKVVLCFTVWGVPALCASPALLRWFGLPVPEDPLFLRSFGALAIAIGVAYWYAYGDPIKNAAILRVGVVDNALATLVVLFSALTSGLSSWFVALTGLLTAGFFLAFLWLMPVTRSSEVR
jgi:hypothetical protein